MPTLAALPTLDPDFDRSSGIGASEVGAALGLSRFVTPYALWARKTGLTPDSPEQTAAMEWGLRLQDPILGALADRLAEQGLKVRRNSVTRRYPSWPHLFATADGFVVQETGVRLGAVDAKAPRSDDGWGPDGSTEVPPDYYAQAQAQCLVYGLPVCYLAVLFHGADFRVYPITESKADQRLMVEALEAWWDLHVEQGEPPAIDAASDSTDAALRAQFREGPELMPTPETTALVEALAMAWVNRKQASDGYDLARQRVEAVMLGYSRLVTPAATVTWTKARDSQVTNWELLAKGYQVALDGTLAVLPDDTLVNFDSLHLTPAGVRAAVDAMPTLYTTTKPGSPTFRVTLPKRTED